VAASGHLAVGKIVKPHGIQGEVTVFALTENAERFAPGTALWLSATPEGERGLLPVRIETARLHQGRWLLTLDRISDRAHAEQHVGAYLVVPRAEAEAARAADEWFLHALVGRSVVEAGGEPLGEVLDVIETAGVAMLEIGGRGRPRRLLPFVREFVVRVEDEEIEVAPPAGWKEL
jgi:16S rRNA processing protein RimM